MTRRDQTADRGRRWCREGRDERQKQEEELWETITQPNNYSFVRIPIIFHQKETFLILLELMIPNTSCCILLTELFTWISFIITQWWIAFFNYHYRKLIQNKSRTLLPCLALPRSSQKAIGGFDASSLCAGSKIIVDVERTWPLIFLLKEKEEHESGELSRACAWGTLETESTMSKPSGHIVVVRQIYNRQISQWSQILKAAAGEEAEEVTLSLLKEREKQGKTI